MHQEIKLSERSAMPYSSKIQLLLYILAIIGYPIIAILSTINGPESQILTIPYRILVVGLSLICLVLLANNNEIVIEKQIRYPLFIFWLGMCFRVFYDTVLRDISDVNSKSNTGIFFFGVVFMPMLPFIFPISRKGIAIVGKTVSLPILLLLPAVCVVAELFDRSYLQFGRFGISSFNPISFGQLGVSSFILGYCLWPTAESRIKPFQIIFVLALGIIGIGAMIASASRGPALSLISCLLLIAIRGRGIISSISGGIGVLVIILIVAFILNNSSDVVAGFNPLERIQELEDPGEYQSSHDRLTMMQDGWNQFLAHPIFGDQIFEENSGTYPHNIIIEAFMSLGIGGGILILWILAFSSKCAWKIMINEKREILWLPLFFFQYLISALVSGSIYVMDGFWIWTISVIAIYSSLNIEWQGSAKPQIGIIK